MWVALVFWVLGQIWFCQIVVYPVFAKVGEADYVAYHRFYSRRIALPVILPGFASLLAPIPLALWGPPVPGWMSAANIAAGAVGLAVTVLLAIPRHNRLERTGRDAAVIAELVRSNWPRTLSITVQAGIALGMLSQATR
ncbi:hypothetical protein [Phenylobacterium sp. CCH12-B4]|uniref:hypothetical protein n=1 Tax=Phenylobacterium sp. CCH12-B4 TaxID=1768784 RepID=UPI0018D229D6|nr:hypothetical protein [Phenylobacterium sp. CCH12-B4]